MNALRVIPPYRKVEEKNLWTQLGNYGTTELLVKIQDQGKRVNSFVLSDTKLVKGGPMSIVSSQQVLLSQFSNRELYFKYITNIIGYPAPMFCRDTHLRRDTPNETL